MPDSNKISIDKDGLNILFDQTNSQEYSDDKLIVGESFFSEYQKRGFIENSAEVFHENTKNSLIHNRTSTIQSAQRFNEGDIYKYAVSRSPDWSEQPTVDLPEPNEVDVSLGEVLRHRRSRRDMSGESISLGELSTLLKFGLGVNRVVEDRFEGPGGKTVDEYLRTYPSPGALYPVETYLLAVNIDGLSSGVYYYKPEEHVLRVLNEDEEIEASIEETFTALESLDPRDSAVTLVFTSMFWRAMAKYGPRGYRYILQESGHMAQNVQLVAEALELAATPNGGILEHDLDPYLGLDGVNESSLYSIVIGTEESTNE